MVPGRVRAGGSAGLMAFEYAVLRIVPRVDRGECVNGAVLLYCQAAGFLGVRLRDDLTCVQALAPDADLAAIEAALGGLAAVADRPGGAEPGGADPGWAEPGGAGDPGRRFRWLTAPRSAVIQPGPVHTGVTTDPAAELDRLAALLMG